MSTWHQDNAMRRAFREGRPIRLYDETKWVILHNPPNKCLSRELFDTEATARTTLERWEKNGMEHLTLLPPSNQTRLK